jgi:hypothetical protein
MALMEGENSLKCENNKIICIPTNVKAGGIAVVHLQQSKGVQSHFSLSGYYFLIHSNLFRSLQKPMN